MGEKVWGYSNINSRICNNSKENNMKSYYPGPNTKKNSKSYRKFKYCKIRCARSIKRSERFSELHNVIVDDIINSINE